MSSLHSITDCAAIAGLLGLFLSALRFRVAVIFNGLYEALSTPRGGLPNQALASTSLGFAGDGLFMSVPLGSPGCDEVQRPHYARRRIGSLVTKDLRSSQRNACGDFPDMVTIAQIFFHMPGNLFAAESKVAFLGCGVPCEFRPRNSGLHVGIAGDLGRQAGGLCVLKVLIAEDDLMIADLAEEILVEAGYEVCGIARTVAEAVALAHQHKPDLAVLDLRLADGGLGTEIAAQLLPLGSLGVLYATGNISQVALTTADGNACLSKPYSSADLVRGLEIVREIVATGKALPPFPKGFQILRPAATAPPAVAA